MTLMDGSCGWWTLAAIAMVTVNAARLVWRRRATRPGMPVLDRSTPAATRRAIQRRAVLNAVEVLSRIVDCDGKFRSQVARAMAAEAAGELRVAFDLSPPPSRSGPDS